MACQVQYELLMELPNSLKEQIKEFFNKYSLRATITTEQDDKLNALKLKSTIPKEFYVETKGYEQYFKNPLARYLSVGIAESLKIFKGI